MLFHDCGDWGQMMNLNVTCCDGSVLLLKIKTTSLAPRSEVTDACYSGIWIPLVRVHFHFLNCTLVVNLSFSHLVRNLLVLLRHFCTPPLLKHFC